MKKDDDVASELMGGEEPVQKREGVELTSEDLFTPEELAAFEREADERVLKAMREAEKERIISGRIQQRKREEGLRSGKPDLDEIVKITIDLPEYAANLRVNNTQYFHGYTYDLPRHVANSLREMMQRAQQHQDVADGKDLAAQYRNRDRHGRMIEPTRLSGGERAA